MRKVILEKEIPNLYKPGTCRWGEGDQDLPSMLVKRISWEMADHAE